MSARVLLVSGKGGVGKTTTAAATAVRAAELGHRTLVVSLDRAHNLGDVLGTPLGANATDVPGCPNLRGMEADPQVELERHASTLQTFLSRFLVWGGVQGARADEVAVIPGLEELLVLSRLAGLVEEANTDLVVVDLAPTASSLRLLSFPELMAGPFGRLVKLERTFFKLARPAAKRLVDMPIPEDSIYATMDLLAERLRRLREILLDPSKTLVRLVSIPERVVIDETRSAHTLLALFGLSVDAVIMNRVLPSELSGSYLDGWTKIQSRELARAKEEFVGLALRSVRFQPDEVTGRARLAELAREMYGDVDPTQALSDVRAVRFHEQDGRPVLSLPLPHAVTGNLDLRQRDGELIVTLGGWRRQLMLPPSLKNRPVTTARLGGGTLHIHFASEESK